MCGEGLEQVSLMFAQYIGRVHSFYFVKCAVCGEESVEMKSNVDSKVSLNTQDIMNLEGDSSLKA